MNKDKIWNYIIYFIWAFIFFSGVWDLFHIPGRSVFWFVELILAVFIYYKIKVPKGIYIGILIIFLANLFGELFLGLFYIVPNFDKIIHLLSPLVVCTLFYFIFEKKIQNKKILILFSVSLLLSWELCWEIVEYFADKWFSLLLAGVHITGVENFKSTLQVMDVYQDTIYDMFYNLIGSVIWAVGALFFTRNKKSTIRKK